MADKLVRDFVFEWKQGDKHIYAWLRVMCNGRVASLTLDVVENDTAIRYVFDTEIDVCRDTPETFIKLLNKLEVKLATIAVIDRLMHEFENTNSQLGC